MRKKIHVVFISLFLITFATQADAPSVLWAKEYGGSVWCYGESVVQTDDGGFIAAGYKEVFKKAGDTKKDFDRIYVVRTDSNGDTLWTKGYGGEGDKAYSIKKTEDGGFVIAGKTSSSRAGSDDFYLVRINLKGDTLWTRTCGTGEFERAYSVDVTRDGGFILAGETTFLNYPSYSVYLVRTDSAGDTLWTKMYNFGEDTSSRANSVIQTDDGGFAVAGWIMGGEWGSFMRTDSSGKLIIKKIFTLQSLNANGVLLRDLKQTSDGGFILIGEISRPIGFDPGVLLVRTDPNGDTLWTKVYTEGFRGFSVDVTEDDGFIVSLGCSGPEASIMKTDSNGDYLWEINSKECEWKGWLKSIKQTADGGFIAAGEGTIDSTGVDMILVRIDKEGTLIQKEKSDQHGTIEGFTLSGNYKDNVIYAGYTIPYSCNVKLHVYDTQGRLINVLVDKHMKKGSHTVTWKTKRYRRKSNAKGVYFLRLSASGHTVSKKITIVK